MSTVDKLLVQGVRSFDPDSPVIIKFNSPLTLILGQNGCGKTTIIECLKYAISGDLPADHSAFVHDPKVQGRVENCAQVKLLCRNIKGKKITVCRTMKVIQKMKKLEFKTLDSTITNDQNNTTSGKCSDIDDVMCLEMGASQVILNDVIFCHQEESDWPLAEKGKKMKDKFDAIFGIAEYNKCLDHINDLIKRMKNEQLVNAVNVNAALDVKTDTLKKKRDLDDVNNKIAANTDTITGLNDKINPIEDKIVELSEKEQDMVKYSTDVMNAENMKKMIVRLQTELRRNIQEIFDGSKEELQNNIKTFEAQLGDKESGLITLELERNKLSGEESRIQKSISDEQMKLGQLQQDNRQNNERIEQRNSSLNSLATDLQLPTMSSLQLTESNGSELLSKIVWKVDELSNKLLKLQEHQECEEKQLQKDIDVCREQKMTMEYDAKAKTKETEVNKCEIRNINAKIAQIDRSTSTLAELDNRLMQVSNQLDDAEKSINVDDLKRQIDQDIVERNKWEATLMQLDKEVKTLQLLSVDQAEMEKLKKSKCSLEIDIKSLFDKHEATLKHLFVDIPDTGLKQKVQNHIDRLTQEVRRKTNCINASENKLTALKAKASYVAEKLRNQRKIHDEIKSDVEEVCCGIEFDQVLTDINKRIDDTQLNKGLHTSSEYIYKRYVSKLQDSDDQTCPVCHRGFCSPDEASAIITELTEKIRDLPKKASQVKRELDTLLEKQSQLLQLKPKHDNLSKLKNEDIPALKSEQTNLNSEIDEFSKEIEEQKAELTIPESDMELSRSMLSDMILIDDYRSRLKILDRDINRLDLKLCSSGSTKTLEEALSEQERIRTNLTNIRKTLERNQDTYASHKDRISTLRQNKNDIVEEQYKLKGAAQERKNLSEKLEELRRNESKLSAELEEAKNQLIPIVQQLENLEKKFEQLKLEHKNTFEAKKAKVDECRYRLHDIRNIQRTIAEYERKGGKEKLSEAYTMAARLEVQKENLAGKLKELQQHIESSKELISNQKLRKSDLDNNLKLREHLEEEVRLDEEIKRLQGCVGEIKLANISKEKRRLQTEVSRLHSQKSNVEGRQNELQNQAIEIGRELNMPKYKNAEENYKKLAYHWKVNGLMIEDLSHFYKAMDWAMIHFHRERMTAINTIIRELWRQIYRGNDIDCIEIQMDEVQATAGGRKRSYNYRVVQYKGMAEMDMAGRCSAGQKVLACLIIRMALAETFSKKCGVLALDEPTTNLDRENIESLSAALADIVSARMTHRNFQLLIITHDKDFLSTLFKVDKVDKYLEVYRDERGKSKVKELAANG